ncbi:MAG: outer membrane beta-barrel protein [Rhodospirillaceae bacterium]|nr:outer membrane beta-barrel protein [Rhodospirillaceae bacterium]
MKRSLLITGLALSVAAPVASVQAQDWQGFYIGASLGYDFQPSDSNETILFDTNLDGRFTENVNTAAGANAFTPGFCGGRAGGARPADGCSKESDGVEFGVRLGYDWQWDTFVLGALAEFSGHNIDDSVSAFSITPARYTMTRELDWMAAARLRAGIAMPAALVYVTGGLSRSDVAHTFSTSNTVNTFTLRGNGDVTGYQLGGGVEWNLADAWNVGAEYLYNKLDDDKHRVRTGPPAPATNPFILVNAAGTDFARSQSKFDYHALRLTLTYRFGG